MKRKDFDRHMQRLYDWINDHDDNVEFIVNGQQCHSLTTNNGKLLIWENDGGERGQLIECPHEQVEAIDWNAEDGFCHVLMDESEDGQGYEIHVYVMTAREFPPEVAP